MDLRPEGKKLWTLTLLRDPVEHTASLYAKIRNHKHAYKQVLRGLSFSQWVQGRFQDDVKSVPPPWGFSFVRFYDEGGDLATAIENVEKVDFVGFTERLTEDMNLFLNLVGEKRRFNGRRLNMSRRGFKISGADRKIIKRVRAEDFELVNHFRRKRGLPFYEGI